MKAKLFTICSLLLTTLVSQARIHSEPKSVALGLLNKNNLPVMQLPDTDIEASLQKNRVSDFQAKPVRFANPNDVDVTTKSHGRWVDVEGGKLWQLRFISDNATDINFGITEFKLPPGVELHFISFADDPVYYDGPYTAEDNRSYNQHWSAPLPGGDVAIELFVPDYVKQKTAFRITRVSTGFRDVFKRYGGTGLTQVRQGACNNDVVCEVGDPWRDEIRSVAAYTVGGIDTCTGTLIMDAERTFRPFFLTAFHCSVTANNAASVVTIWNYESVNCGDLSGGSRADTVSGSVFRASRQDVDMGLLELSAEPPEEYNVYYAGWDTSGAVPTGSVGIHHPGVDEKAISFNTDPLTTVNNCIGGGGSNTHWEVDNWEDGTTEPGSSGSGIWDPVSRQIVGYLSGGTASCNSITSDCYGKFSEGWDNGGPDNQNMKPWLDPNNTGIVSIDGSNPKPFSLVLENNLVGICTGDDAVYNVTIGQSDPSFTDPVTLSTSVLPGSATAGFSANPVVPPATSILTISNTGGLASGNYQFDVFADSGTNNLMSSATLLVSSNVPGVASLVAPAQGATGVASDVTFSWSAVADSSGYLIEVATDAGFANTVISEVVSDTNYQPSSSLASNTTYYWRVTATNGCGDAAPSSVYSFTTSNEICFNGSIAIPDNNPSGIVVPLTVNQPGFILDLNVSVVSNHTWPGDLIFTLSHTGSGNSIELMNRPGSPNTTNGCSQDGVDVLFDEASAVDVESYCNNAIPGIGGTLNPDGDLNLFNSQVVSGEWVLSVSDNVGQDTGVISQFCLIPDLEVIDLIFENGFDPNLP